MLAKPVRERTFAKVSADKAEFAAAGGSMMSGHALVPKGGERSNAPRTQGVSPPTVPPTVPRIVAGHRLGA